MTAGASHSDYHIDDNYTQLFLLRKTNNIPAKSFPVDGAEAVLDYLFKMFFCAVAFMLVKTILGIFFCAYSS